MVERKTPIRDTVRYLVWALPLIAVGLVAYTVWKHFNEKDRVIAEQRRIIAELGVKLDRAFAEELVADVTIDRMYTDAAGEKKIDATFIQYRPGTEIEMMKKSFTLSGEEIYIDTLVVQFERAFVEGGDVLRGKSLLLFRRAFGDKQKPVDGVPLIRGKGESNVPEVAQVDATPSTFEAEIWDKFWAYANDPKAAAAAGIKVAQGEAVSKKAVQGQVYQLKLRSSGGVTMEPRLPDAVLNKRDPEPEQPKQPK
jgi:hypothetical protein